jgi:hypothetical protein
MIVDNINSVKNKIALTCEKIAKNQKDITFVAVTKTVSIDLINEAIAAGIKDIGESKLQEALPKLDKIPKDVKKHFIGHLQSNKAGKVVHYFDLIQSVDSLRLLEEINRQALKAGKIQDCLLELKVSGEETKFGFAQEEINSVLNNIDSFKNIRLCGLMAMAPYFDDLESSRPYFKEAKKVFDEVRANSGLDSFTTLSMGMSHDYQTAIEEGSTMVRIGTAIFGERNYNEK